MEANKFTSSGAKTLNTGCVAIEGNNNIANATIRGNNNIVNAGIIFGNVMLNSSINGVLCRALLNALNKQNELLEHLISLHPEIDKEIVTSSK